ncbi:hypothetical protein LJK87_45715 [Paenibacillus sp. P25]|nr:hypothetical protein LJK87_45715 [Paenibacillus sp. P25]
MTQRSKLSVLLTLVLLFQPLLPAIGAWAATDNGSILPPSNLAAQLPSPDTVKLTWSTVYGATGYNVYSIVSGQLTKVGTVTSATYTLNSLPQGDYGFVVSTLSSGGESGPCAPVNVTITYPAMTAPTPLTYSIQNGNNVVLNWGASLYAQTYNVYQILANGQKNLLTSVTGRSYTVVNVPEGTWSYAVTAVHPNFGESPLSTTVQVNVVNPTMAAPSGLTSSVSGSDDLTLRWNTATYATSYKVYQIIDGQKVLKNTVTSTSVTFANLPAGSYTYEVHSFSDRFGESADGDQITVAIGTLAPPTNLTYKLQNINDIVLNWTSCCQRNEL